MKAGVTMNVLVVDIGGSHVKIPATGQDEPRKFVSGCRMGSNANVFLGRFQLLEEAGDREAAGKKDMPFDERDQPRGTAA